MYLHTQIDFLQKLYILSWWLSADDYQLMMNISPTTSDAVITVDRFLQTMVLVYMLFKGLSYIQNLRPAENMKDTFQNNNKEIKHVS